MRDSSRASRRPVINLCASSNTTPPSDDATRIPSVYSLNKYWHATWTTGVLSSSLFSDSPKLTRARISKEGNTAPCQTPSGFQCEQRSTQRCGQRPRQTCRGRCTCSSGSRTENVMWIVVAGCSTLIIHNSCPFQKHCPWLSRQQRIIAWKQRIPDIRALCSDKGSLGGATPAEALWRVEGSNFLGNITNQISHKLEDMDIPRIIENPPPPLTLAACLGLVFAIAAFRHSHKHDLYQDHITGAGILVGIVVASVLDDPLIAAKTMIPSSAICAMILSALGHRVLKLFAEAEIIDAGGGVAEKE